MCSTSRGHKGRNKLQDSLLPHLIFSDSILPQPYCQECKRKERVGLESEQYSTSAVPQAEHSDGNSDGTGMVECSFYSLVPLLWFLSKSWTPKASEKRIVKVLVLHPVVSMPPRK